MTMAKQILQPKRTKSTHTVPSPENVEQHVGRSNSSLKHELKHQIAIRNHLDKQFGQGSQHLYHRLDLGCQKGTSGPTPYLNDIAKRDEAVNLADSFLKEPETQHILSILAARCKEPLDIMADEQRARSAAPAPMSSTHLPMTTAVCDHAPPVVHREVIV